KAKVRSGRGTSLPFYQDHALLEYIVAPVIGEPAPVYLLAGHERGGLQWLDGTSAPIHRANDLEKVSITAATAISYLRFFMYFVRGDEGQFVMIEDAAQFQQGAAAGAHLARLQALVEPLELQPAGEGGGFKARMLVAYAGSVFRCDMLIMENGAVEMADDDPLATLDGATVEPGHALLPNPFPQQHTVMPVQEAAVLPPKTPTPESGGSPIVRPKPPR